MRINHNIAALNTYRQLSTANGAQSKSMEKLSSGLRINRAGDDAAGLAISEKMRGQIRGLDMASKNAQDGISLIQTAEGALNETHDILQRMRELAVQSSNDSNTDTDREELQKEMDQLIEEIDRIGNTTEFNTKKLIDGALSGTSSTTESVSFDNKDDSFASVAITTVGTSEDNTYNVKVTGIVRDGTGAITGYDLSWEDKAGVTGSATNIAAGGTQAIGAFTLTLGASMSVGDEATFSATTSSYDNTDTSLSLQIGANSSQTMNVSIGDMRAAALNVDDIDVTSSQSAQASTTAINKAIESVSAQRSKLGAFQNRLEHTINNLGTSAENLTAAESRIRDVDYALAA
ncbi:flagellin N-terminal helical domain-containing protein [Bacillus sp. J33]|uniref:flagellin N-terminal helical domain-containing protein n=1 Tax=Bacillus sp. J33 TaxID=935836 RepID=UPI00047C229B|nr:flagellin [Bacillus sp. J33]